MEINIIHSYSNAHKARGLTIVIDVLRAFTTACYVFQNGASHIVSVSELDTAYQLKKDNPDYVLMGERKGLKQPGFAYGNSPQEIKDINFSGKTVILTTSSGTRGITGATHSDEIITGAFVNAKATIKYIQKKKPKIISFVCTDARFKDGEDAMYAQYIASLLTKGRPLSFRKIKKHLTHHPIADGFLRKPMTKFSIKDFHLSLTLDTFPFVIQAKKLDGLIYLLKT